MEERVVRIIAAAEIKPSVNDGRIQYSGPYVPDAGSHRRFTAKISTSIMPSQKFGIATPSRPTAEDSVSNSEYWRMAETMPKKMPSTTEMIEL